MPKIANAFVLTADQNVTPRHMKPMTPSVCVLSSESSENINNNLNTSLIQGTLNSSTIESNGMVLQARSPFVSGRYCEGIKP